MFEPVKIAFAEWMGHFYQSLVPATRGMSEFCSRGLEKSIAWAPGRMVDAAEDMLESWQRNDTDGTPGVRPKLPVILVAMSRDMTPTGREFTRNMSEAEYFIFPCDPKERAFRVRSFAADVRVQIAIVAHDEPTARAIAAQFLLFADTFPNRKMPSTWRFAGMDHHWPVVLETAAIPAMSVPTDAKNITLLALDVILKATVPLFEAPKVGEPNDGKGDPANPEDPAGYPLVSGMNPSARMAAP